MTQSSRTARPFTGKHITLILVSFFGIVIAVNVLMARLASSTFGGVVVENSYVASQQFNHWLKEASAEQALGWKAELARDGQGRAAIALRDSTGRAIAAAKVTAVAEHPLGQRPEADLILHETAPGAYTVPLEAGRWRLRVTVEAEGKVWRTVGEVL
ncbi:MAG: FixH family protein [Novosphingobium sp.]